MRDLHAKYPDDADIATVFGEAYMNTTRWDYWESDGSAKPGALEGKAALEAAMAASSAGRPHAGMSDRSALFELAYHTVF